MFDLCEGMSACNINNGRPAYFSNLPQKSLSRGASHKGWQIYTALRLYRSREGVHYLFLLVNASLKHSPQIPISGSLTQGLAGYHCTWALSFA
ncbi:MAG: hypothetical protein II954_10420 [Synergistaceae bacterium]|nr:hypothetical protein [Synergistaceae bacterium]